MPNRPTRVLISGGLVLVVALLLPLGTPTAVGQVKEPVYVGVRVCSECHEGTEAGHQFSLWRLSKHAKAYATLSLPASEEIARRSGIPEAPLEARVCLGCHTTGADAEEWRRDETFLIEDGVQCETCHGPGSEYIAAEVMQNRELAMERGLVMPTRQTCMVCHGPKGSHEVVLEPSPWEYEGARQIIAHPRPAQAVGDPSGSGQGPPRDESAPRFAGVMACAGCHAGAEMGFQYSRWRMGPHAGAYASLATPWLARWRRRPEWSATPRRVASVCGAMLPAPVSTPRASHPVSTLATVSSAKADTARELTICPKRSC